MKLTAWEQFPIPVRKLWKVMRITTILILIASLHLSAKTSAQNITLNSDNITVKEFFSQLKKQTGYSFFFNENTLSSDQKVNVHVRDANLDDVLNQILSPFSLSYKIDNKIVYILKNSPTGDPQQEENPLPPGEIHGRVTTSQGVSLSGANIIIKRTKRGTQTDVRGEFDLKNVYPDDTLVVSFIGYKTQRIKVGTGKDFPLVLEETKNELDQVVVQAYGTTTQRLNTGNIATVTAAQIERQPVMNVLEALQGQVPGLVIQQTNGYASAPFKVNIRGTTSLNPNIPSDPLYIIDGVPLTVLGLPNSNGGSSSNIAEGSFNQNGFYGPAGGQSPFFSINPADIESVTVLKDADATAIYGSRGGNGVIIITTKKGKPGKIKLDLNIYSGTSKSTGRYDLLNLSQYLEMRREAFKNDGITPDAGNGYDLLIFDTTKTTDWQKESFGHIGETIDAAAALSGGDNLTTFRISTAYHHETSILSYSGADQRASVQFNLSRKSVDQRLNISFTSIYSYTQSDLISFGAPSALAPPDAPGDVFDKQGNLNYAAWVPVAQSFPFASILQPYTAKTDFLNSQLTFQYEIIKGLTATASLGYSVNHQSQVQLTPIASLNPYIYPKGQSTFGNNNGNRAIVEPQIEYKSLIGKGKFSALVGGSIQNAAEDGNTILGSGYINDAFLSSVSNAPVKNAFNSNGEYKYAAIFSRVNYNWEDKYILNLTARRDGSSRFGPENRFGNFGAAGVAWIFTEENWLKNHLGSLSFGKIRASYGTTGNDEIGDYQYLTAWSASNISPYQQNSTVPSYIPLYLANPNFHWQVNKKLEAAMSLGFFKDRINIEASFYRDRCGNQLTQFPLPAIAGFSTVLANSPADIQNSGWELTFHSKIIEHKNLTLGINLNAGRNYNKLLSYPNLAQSPYAETYTVGQPLSRAILLHFTGVDPQTGQYTFKDMNKDGAIVYNYPNQGGDQYYKEVNILLDGGFGADLRFKSLQLNILFTYRVNPFVQSAIYSTTPGFIANQSTQVLDRWEKPGDLAKFASYTTQIRLSDEYFGGSDGQYSNGSYIRLRNVSLSYDLNSNWVRGAGLKGCSVYFHGQNLFILTKYNGIDPDTPTLGALPPAKIITLGIQFIF